MDSSESSTGAGPSGVVPRKLHFKTKYDSTVPKSMAFIIGKIFWILLQLTEIVLSIIQEW